MQQVNSPQYPTSKVGGVVSHQSASDCWDLISYGGDNSQKTSFKIVGFVIAIVAVATFGAVLMVRMAKSRRSSRDDPLGDDRRSSELTSVTTTRSPDGHAAPLYSDHMIT
jgi:hypothetical protein